MKSLALDKNALDFASRYIVRVEITRFREPTAFAQMEFATTRPPYGGNCSIHPLVGEL